MVVAGIERRFIAAALDAGAAGLATLPLNPAVYGIANVLPEALIMSLSALAVVFGLLVVFEGGSAGATPGKRTLGIAVVDARTHHSIGYRRAAVRRAAHLAGALPLLRGWLVALDDAQHRAWHDRVAGSIVIRRSRP
jgi:uncharacterized RDD family membrane protein YckC